MSIKTIVACFDQLLAPLGFSRQKATWNRRAGFGVDAIDVQRSKGGDTFTINAGVLDRDVHAKLWGVEASGFTDVPTCTVSARIGDLLGAKDTWWSLNDDHAVRDAVGSVSSQVFPFLERMHSRQAIADWLVESGVLRKRYPMPIISLAILRNFAGEVSESCELLAEMQRRSLGAWSARAAEVAARLGCADKPASLG